MKINIFLVIALLFATLKTSNAQKIPSYIPKDSLIGWWPFNGNANDESGQNKHGKVIGAILSEDRNGNPNKAYYINSPAPGISVDSVKIKSFNFTLSYWVNYQSIPSTANISDISHDWYKLGCFNVYRDTNNKITVATPAVSPNWEQFSKKTVIDSNTILNQWMNIVIVRSGIKVNIYKNGNFISTTNNTNFRGYLTQNLFFGGDPTKYAIDSNAKFNGTLDDIGIWNRPLTAQEVSDLYQSCNLSIIEHPKDQNAFWADKASFTVIASDTNAIYQWQADYQGAGFENILTNDPQFSGNKSSTLTVMYALHELDSMKLRCILNIGPCIDTTQTATLHVYTKTNNNAFRTDGIINIYPNPAKELITILSSSDYFGKIYTIYDAQGKSIQNGIIHSQNMQLKINHLAEGIYWISIDNNVAKKFIIIN